MRTGSPTIVAAIAFLAAALCTMTARAVVPGEYRAADPSAPPVTAENLLDSERFWPYRVSLQREWKPEGDAATLPAGTRGILVRVGPQGLARVDFSRDGRFEVPIDALDVVERANSIRLGREEKLAPIFVHTIGTRLVDSAFEVLRIVDISRVYEPRVFVAVFADPAAEEFAALAQSLAPLRESPETMTVLFPQGEHRNASVRARLRELGWPVAFLRDEYGEGYARSLRGDAGSLPAVMVVTREGRLLLDLPWRGDETAAEVRRALVARPPAGAALVPAASARP